MGVDSHEGAARVRANGSWTRQWCAGRIVALEVFAAILAVLVVSLGSFQLHFTLPVTGFVLFLIIVVAALRLGFWQATVTSVMAVGCLDFFFTQPLFSLKTDAAGLTALAAFESAALVVSRLSAQVQLQAHIANQQRNNMERLYELARNILLVNRHEPTGPQIAAFIQQAVGGGLGGAVRFLDAAGLRGGDSGARSRGGGPERLADGQERGQSAGADVVACAAAWDTRGRERSRCGRII